MLKYKSDALNALGKFKSPIVSNKGEKSCVLEPNKVLTLQLMNLNITVICKRLRGS